MEITVKTRYLRMSPRKVRLVANSIVKLSVERALEQLNFQPKIAALPLMKLLQSGIAAAEHNFKCSKNNLIVKSVLVNQGPTLKRWRPRAFGRAAEIRKRTAHLIVILEDPTTSNDKKAKKIEDKKDDVIKVTDFKTIKKDKKVGKHSDDSSKTGEKGVDVNTSKFTRQKSV